MKPSQSCESIKGSDEGRSEQCLSAEERERLKQSHKEEIQRIAEDMVDGLNRAVAAEDEACKQRTPPQKK